MAHPVTPIATAPSSAPTDRALPWGLPAATGIAWIAGAWAILRLDPEMLTSITSMIVAALALGAVSQVIQAFIAPGTRLVHGGLAAVSAGLATLVLLRPDSPLSWLAGLVGGYLMLHGVADLAISLATRPINPAWGLGVLAGLAGLILGFVASGRMVTATAFLMGVLVAALCLIRGIGDLCAASRLRETTRLRRQPQDPMTAGYAAGRADFTARRLVATGPGRHSAEEPDEPVVVPAEPRTAVAAMAGAPPRTDRGPTPAGSGGTPVPTSTAAGGRTPPNTGRTQQPGTADAAAVPTGPPTGGPPPGMATSGAPGTQRPGTPAAAPARQNAPDRGPGRT